MPSKRKGVNLKFTTWEKVQEYARLNGLIFTSFDEVIQHLLKELEQQCEATLDPHP